MLSGVDYEICKTQGNVYEYLAKNGYDMELFSELYLQSDFCRRAFDTNYSRFQLADELECLDFIVPELKESYPEFSENITEDYKKVKEVETCFSPDVAYWIGFTYRQLYIETGITSRELSERLPFDAMCRYYPGLHTVDEEMATDIICKDYHFAKQMPDMDDHLYKGTREFYDRPVEIGQWCSYAPYANKEQLELQRENLVEIGNLYVAEGRLKLIYTKRMKTLCAYLEKATEEVPLTDAEVSMETEIFFTSKIEGAKTTRVRTTEIHNGAPVDENDKDSETMVRNGFRAVKILNLYGNKISKDILCEVWNILVEDCCQNEDIRGAEDEYRIGDTWVGNHEGVPHTDVEDAMKRWIAFYNSEELNEHLFLKAAVLHYAFENIHPFPDGNGRLGRLLMNNFLIKNGVESAKEVSFSMAIDANRGLYDGAFVSSENELADCTPFVEYMLEAMAMAYSTALVSAQ